MDKPTYAETSKYRTFSEEANVCEVPIDCETIAKVELEHKITPEAFEDLIVLVHSNYVEAYDPWYKLIFAIQDVVLTHAENWNWDDDSIYELGLEMACLLSARSRKYPDEYKPEDTKKVWDQRLNQGDLSDRSPNLGTLIYFAEKSNSVGLREWKYRWMGSALGLKSYDPRINYCLLDYKRDLRNKHFASLEDARRACVNGMLKFIREIDGAKRRYLIRSHSHATHEIVLNDPRRTYYDWFLTYDDVAEDSQGKPYKIKRDMNIFYFISDDRLCCKNAVFYPVYESEHDIFIAENDYDTANTFPGFEFNFVDEVEMDLIQPWRDHIKDVFASGNEEYFKYIENWLSFSLQFPREKQPCLVLTGPDGCGKTIFCDFLVKCVWGELIAIADACFDGVFSRFNGSMEECCLLTINEASSVNRGNAKGEYGKIRSLVYDKYIMIERKGQEKYQTLNFIKMIITSNDRSAIVPQDDDRHFAIFSCDSCRVDSAEYFEMLKGRLTREVGNHFATYYYRRPKCPYFNMTKPPVTSIKQETLMGATWLYIKEIQSGGWEYGEGEPVAISRHNVKIKDENGKLTGKTRLHFMTSEKEIYDDFIAWQKKRKKNFDVDFDAFIKLLKGKFRKAHTRQKRIRRDGLKTRETGFFIDLMGFRLEKVRASGGGVRSIPEETRR